MTNEEAVRILRRIQEPEAWEPQINGAAFEALDMAIEALSRQQAADSKDLISRSSLLAKYDEQHEGPPGRARKLIEDEQPAKQGTTTMTVGRTKGETTMWYECGWCGEPVDQADNFCRNCGRRFQKDGIG